MPLTMIPSTLGVDPERRQALLDLVALHLVRSSETLAFYNKLLVRCPQTLVVVARPPFEAGCVL